MLYDAVAEAKKVLWGENMVRPLVVKAKTVYGGPTMVYGGPTMAKVASSTY